jgi:hypothetical protein
MKTVTKLHKAISYRLTNWIYCLLLSGRRNFDAYNVINSVSYADFSGKVVALAIMGVSKFIHECKN